MNSQDKEESRKHKHRHRIRLPRGIFKLVIIIVVISALAGAGIGITKHFETDGKTTKLGFENIGELATQSVTCTTVRVDTKDRKLFGVTIPFTTSKVIYSYNSIIKAGIDFSAVKLKIGDTKQTEKNIYVDIPEIKILSTDIDLDSFKLYDENESIFSPITLNEHNDSMKELESTAKKDAIDNGLYDNALDNAKVLLNAFIEQVYDPNIYHIIFRYKDINQVDQVDQLD